MPKYFDFGYLDDGRPYAVLEYLRGETLAEYLSTHGPLEVKVARHLMEQVARTMAAAHACGIVHRDLKLDNLFVVDSGQSMPRIKILDFGIAYVTPAEDDARLTRQGDFLGTPQFCAPEQVYGRVDDPVVDVYALGVCGFAMLTGRLPFEGPAAQILADKNRQAPPRLDELQKDAPAQVTSLIDSMLARAPDARPQSMDAVIDGLGTWPTSLTRNPSNAPAEPRRWRPLLWGAITVAAVIALQLLWSDWRLGPADDVPSASIPTDEERISVPAPTTPPSLAPASRDPRESAALQQDETEEAEPAGPDAEPDAEPDSNSESAGPARPAPPPRSQRPRRRRASTTPPPPESPAGGTEPVDDVVIANPFE